MALTPRQRIITFIQRRFANPLMGSVPTQTLLETTGRKSGQPRRTPIGGRLGSNKFWLVSEFGERSQYVRNIQADPRVRVRVGGRWHAGTAHLLPDDDAKTRLAELPRTNSAAVRALGDNLLTIRIDLDE
jgi:deazaflavin-dependent oxidoreductase (nitroreductase family)